MSIFYRGLSNARCVVAVCMEMLIVRSIRTADIIEIIFIMPANIEHL